jgi:hypothetical protein
MRKRKKMVSCRVNVNGRMNQLLVSWAIEEIFKIECRMNARIVKELRQGREKRMALVSASSPRNIRL